MSVLVCKGFQASRIGTTLCFWFERSTLVAPRGFLGARSVAARRLARGEARRRATQDLEGVGSEQLRQKCLELQEAVRSLLEAEGASQSSFEQLRESNDQLEEVRRSGAKKPWLKQNYPAGPWYSWVRGWVRTLLALCSRVFGREPQQLGEPIPSGRYKRRWPRRGLRKEFLCWMLTFYYPRRLIDAYIRVVWGVNVGIYSSPMECMGMVVSFFSPTSGFVPIPGLAGG